MSEQKIQPVRDIGADIVETISGNPGITVPEIAAKLRVPASLVYGEMPRIAEAVVRVDRQFYSPGSEPQPKAAPSLPEETAPAVPARAEQRHLRAGAAAVVVISHTNTEGTLVHGTSRGDGSREALRAVHFKWSSSLGCWYKPGSRGRAAKRATIEVLRQALADAGFTVTVEIADYDASEAFVTLQTHSGERADVHSSRAARANARSDEAYRASNEAVRGIEPGQPILRGHHSQRRHERDLARSHAHMSASVAHSRQAERSAGRAAEAERQTRRRENPVVMGRRIERLEAEQRTLERRLKGASEAPIARGELEDIKREIAFLRQAVAESGVKQYTKADIQPGDYVQIRGQWREVAKANTKTVAVKTACSWTDKYPYYEITGHRRPDSTSPASS